MTGRGVTHTQALRRLHRLAREEGCSVLCHSIDRAYDLYLIYDNQTGRERGRIKAQRNKLQRTEIQPPVAVRREYH